MAIGAGFWRAQHHVIPRCGTRREIAPIRALDFGGKDPPLVFPSFVIEALLIAFIGGLSAHAVLPLNGLTTGAMNLPNVSHVAFAVKITPELLVKGIVFALVMGIIGRFLPAVRAASMLWRRLCASCRRHQEVRR